MSRIDANYFRKKLKEEKENFEIRVDEWLREIALPYYTGDNSGYEITDELFLRKWAEFIDSLRNRGFIVTTQSMSDGNYIYLSVPSGE